MKGGNIASSWTEKMGRVLGWHAKEVGNALQPATEQGPFRERALAHKVILLRIEYEPPLGTKITASKIARDHPR